MKSKKIISICLFLFLFIQFSMAQKENELKKSNIDFDKFFISKTLRIDYFLTGNSNSETVSFNEMREEPYWGGSKTNLIDKFNYGNFRIRVFDSLTNQLLYSKGFSTLFEEWQSTKEAKVLNKAFYQCAVIPYPKKTIRFEIDKRVYEDCEFYKIFDIYINPNNYFIKHEKPKYCKATKIISSGDADKNIDIAFLAEGYTKNEMSKFREDVKRIFGYITAAKPFDKYKNKFNVYAVESISDESGTDVPGEGIYKNTALNTSYYTFDVDRYLTTFDMKSLHDYAANVPYDQIYVLINSKRYGGGGFFNYYTASTVDNILTPKVCVHEFGHGFAGLADEYYTSNVAYNDFYNLKTEPWEPNISTMVNDDKKWKDMVKKATPVPTPRTKEFENTVGFFEGGGYVAKGIYSPYQDCRMKSNKAKGFCPVCQRAIERMIKFYCE